jgi:HK97 gp10 family phage protein
VASELEGVAELSAKLRALADPKQQAMTLRAAVRTPMKKVEKRARANIARISPGKAEMHRTYKGRLVSAGFASRSLRTIVKMSRDKQSASALLGVRREAFYALQFFELGTAYIPRQPWLVPAFEGMKEQSLREIGIVMRKRIEKIAKQRMLGGR